MDHGSSVTPDTLEILLGTKMQKAEEMAAPPHSPFFTTFVADFL